MSNEEDFLKEVPLSNETKIPRWLKLTYLILPFVGFLLFYLYWDGSNGFLDRGHWRALQEAARTTGPYREP